MLLGHYIIISIFLGRRPNVQDFNVSKQPWAIKLKDNRVGTDKGQAVYLYSL